MKTQLATMLDLQEAMNIRVHSDWRNQGFEWYRAIWVECAELMDHYGWKWWKKQTPDTEQVKLELIDIWHFGLSSLLQNNVSLDDIHEQAQLALNNTELCLDFKQAVEEFASHTLTTKSFSIGTFIPLLYAVEMEFEDLYTGYIGKNVLNFFRQDHGYQDGSYQKVWGGREDNEHLVDIIQGLDASSKGFKDSLYSALEERYKSLL